MTENSLHQYAIAGFTFSSCAALCAKRVMSAVVLSLAGSCAAMAPRLLLLSMKSWVVECK